MFALKIFVWPCFSCFFFFFSPGSNFVNDFVGLYACVGCFCFGGNSLRFLSPFVFAC